MKAFDSMSHNSKWKALEICGIEQHCISLLRRLYPDQKATALTDKAGRPAIQFALQHCTPSGFEKRPGALAKEKGMGMCLGDNETDRLTNLRFADAVCDVFGATTKNDV